MAQRIDHPTGEGAAPEVTVRRMDAIGRDVRTEVTDVILDGYFSDLSVFTKDRRSLAIAFRDHLRPDLFYCAELDGRIAGVLACSDSSGRALVADRASFRRGLGYVRGSIAARLLAPQFNGPLPYGSEAGYIEWVATSAGARGKGVCTALFRHVMQHLRHQTLVLEVVDTNEGARRLYAKLGFDEFERRPARGIEKLTFTECISMRWSVP